LLALGQRFGFSLPAVFIAYSQRSLSVPKPAKQNGSIKEEVKKKHLSNGGSFSCFAAHLIEGDLF
jgi:hypothetical protein